MAAYLCQPHREVAALAQAEQKHIRDHYLAAEWEVLKQRVRDFLNSFADGTADLLRYIGPRPLPD